MTEATGGGGRAEVERSPDRGSLEDGASGGGRWRTPRRPSSGSSKRLPEGVQVRVVEETADTIYLMLRPLGRRPDRRRLSDRDPETVAGGDTWTCSG